MEELLDYSPPTHPNFKKAKLLLKVMVVTFTLSFVCAFVARFFPINSDVINLIIALPMLVVILLAPIGLFYIIRSYVKKEKPAKRRLIYLLGIIFFNLIFLLCIALFIIDVGRLFYKQ